jgi:hypothetical protein
MSSSVGALYDTPEHAFGYFSHDHRALIMNIATAGARCPRDRPPVHQGNFRTAPRGSTRGLGSLYEQCGDRNGHITA